MGGHAAAGLSVAPETPWFFLACSSIVCPINSQCFLRVGVLALLAGKYREQNLFYRALRTVTHPVVHAVRFTIPRFILAPTSLVLTFFLLFWLWIVLALVKRHLCGLHGLACRTKSTRFQLDGNGANRLNCRLFWPVSSVGRAAD